MPFPGLSLAIVLPCFNEEQNIERTIQDTVAWMTKEGIDGEIVAVDDGSRDRTLQILERLKETSPILKIVRHEVNRGYGSAVRTGCDSATKEFVSFMDSDGQFHPEDFSLLLPHLKEYDYVTGRRIHRADPFIRKVNAKLFGFLVFAVLGVWIRDVNCAMKVWKRAIWPKIRPSVSTGALVNAEVFFRLKKNGIPWKQVPVRHEARKFGVQTGANPTVILRMFRDLLRLRRGYARGA